MLSAAMAPVTRVPSLRLPGVGLWRTWRVTGRGDLIAGLAVAAYLVPQCLAYARLAGLRPIAGLWAALPALLAYALLGTSPALSIGPESASALIVASTVASLARPGVNAPAIAAALAFAVGVICLLAWVIRLGFLADLLSKPVLVGYLAGVSITMIASQLPTLTGIAVDHRDTLGRTRDTVSGFRALDPRPLLMGAAVVAALLVAQRFKRAPGALIVVLAATVITSALQLTRHGIQTVGSVPRGLPQVTFPSLPVGLWIRIVVDAAGVALVVFSGDILTGRAFAHNGAQRIDADQELLALGGANALAGLVGGFPVSSSDSRAALAVATGGASQLASVVSAGCVLVVLLFAGP
ncbi:MAG: SulP family inorganic anion transporter, partial [Acidimicrobiales bacterium]